MNDKKNTQLKIDELIDASSSIEVVDAPPFFKDKVLKRLSQKTENNKVIDLLAWFSPKYQIAALLVFAFINLSVLYLYNDYNQSQKIETFAEAYGFSSSDSESILN